MDGAEGEHMYELDFEQEENYSVTKSHEEILRLIEEIKAFEKED